MIGLFFFWEVLLSRPDCTQISQATNCDNIPTNSPA